MRKETKYQLKLKSLYTKASKVLALKELSKILKCSKIDYGKKSDSRRLFRKGFYQSPLLSLGNGKIDQTVLIYSNLPVRTCLNCTDCHEDCYAKRDCFLYDTVFIKQAMNTWLAQNYLNDFKNWIINDIKEALKTHKGIQAVRIHEAGDFFNFDYVKVWLEIVKIFPNLKFYFYTNTLELFDFSSFFDLENCNIISSTLPLNLGSNFGEEKAILEKARILRENGYRVHVCGYSKTNRIQCGFGSGACHACIEKGKFDFILFIKH